MIRIQLSGSHLSGNELVYVKDAFSKNQVSLYGDNLSSFESNLEDYLEQSSFVSCLSSGTAALHLALILANVQQGDEIICQSFTFSASANPVLYLGAKPIFIDSESETWNMCPRYLEEAIIDRIAKGKKPKAIIVVHLYGMPAEMDEILKISRKYEIILIEDAAEALGSHYKGQKCGTFGDFGILSFNGNKIISTSGGGGLITRNLKLKVRSIFLATQARDEAPHYQHSEIGYNYRMSNVLAGIGRGQMEVLNDRISLRRNMHKFYFDLFNDVSGVQLFSEPSTDFYSNHWLSCVLIEEKITGFSREDLRLQLDKDNIESRPLWKPMHLQPVFNDCLYYGKTVAEDLFTSGLCLPSGSNLNETDRDRIKSSINNLLKF